MKWVDAGTRAEEVWGSGWSWDCSTVHSTIHLGCLMLLLLQTQLRLHYTAVGQILVRHQRCSKNVLPGIKEWTRFSAASRPVLRVRFSADEVVSYCICLPLWNGAFFLNYSVYTDIGSHGRLWSASSSSKNKSLAIDDHSFLVAFPQNLPSSIIPLLSLLVLKQSQSDFYNGHMVFVSKCCVEFQLIICFGDDDAVFVVFLSHLL